MIVWPAVEHRHVPLAAGRLHVVRAGEGDPLLLVHGGHGSWTHWVANIGPLSARRAVYAPDLPGFGDSFTPPRPYDLGEYRDAVRELMRVLDLGRIALAGFSFGSLVAAEVAAAEPSRVERLVLVNPPGTGRPSPEAIAIRERLSAIAREQSRRAAVAESLRRLMLADPGRVTGELIDLTLANVERTTRPTRDLSHTTDLLATLGRIEAPVLVLLGEEDPHQRHELPERRARIERAIGRGRVEVLRRASHWLQLEHAERFHALASEFLGEPPR